MKMKCLVATAMLMLSVLALAAPDDSLLNNSRHGYVPGIRKALQDGASINEAMDYEGNTALMLAAGAGKLDAVKFLIEKGADINKVGGGDSQSTALIEAGDTGTPQVIFYLASRGANLNAVTRYRQTAMIRAAYAGRTGNIKALLAAGADPNHRDDFGAAIHAASKNGYADVIQALLAGKANANQPSSSDGYSALMFAASGGNLEASKVLLDAGADVNAQMSVGTTALVFAAENKKSDVGLLLLNRGANPNILNNEKKSALWWAARYGQVELVQKLLEKGAASTINVESSSGYTAMGAAIDNEERIDEDQHRAMIEMMRNAGGRAE